jgi:hypothetical protein
MIGCLYSLELWVLKAKGSSFVKKAISSRLVLLAAAMQRDKIMASPRIRLTPSPRRMVRRGNCSIAGFCNANLGDEPMTYANHGEFGTLIICGDYRGAHEGEI